jgi:DNA-binding SARP family transcriptional activator
VPDRLQVFVLGPVRARSADRALSLGTVRQRTVFAVLVAAANLVVTHQELIVAVWGTSPPVTARDNLYTYVSGLRRVLGGDSIESRSAGYLLRLNGRACDAGRFTAMVAEAAERERAGERADAAARLGDALALWHGEAYAGLDGDVLEAERAHLTRLRLEAIERWARILIELGDDGLVAELSALVREHPLHEPLYELLMRALDRAGRPAEALEVFRRAREVLATELGVEPGIHLQELHRRLLEPAPADLPQSAWEMLRLASLLGPELRADVLVAATRRPPLAVLADLDCLQAADVLHDAGAGLAFRDPAFATATRDGIAQPVRARQHRWIAEVLAGLGAPAAEVAGHLTAEPLRADRWMLSWVLDHLAEVTDRAPRLAARLTRLLLRSPLGTAAEHETLLVAYVRADLLAGGRPVRAARQAIDLVTDAAYRAEMRHAFATLRWRGGDRAQAATLLTTAVADRRTPPIWLTRHRMLLARAGRAGDPYDRVADLQARWWNHSVRREHDAALRCVDRALGLLGSRTLFAELHLDLLDNRIFSLQNLDRLDEADRELHKAGLVGTRHRLAAPLAVSAVVQHFWAGRWDDAVARTSTVTGDSAGVGLFGRREQRAGTLLLNGVAAVIAAHRDEPHRAAAHLTMSPLTDAERENGDFLLVARALLTERRGHPDKALDILAPLLDAGYAPMLLSHQWLPDLLRSAQQARRTEIAERAAERCAAEAAKERTPARAGAALARCRALLSGDPEGALAAAAQYRSVGRVLERAAALEDAAVLLAARGHAGDAARCEDEAAELYRRLGAQWDLRRLRSRLEEVLL